MASPAVDFARNNQPRFLDELKTLLRIPSISTLDEHKSDVQKAAEFVAAELRRIGMDNVEIIPTKGHPLLYADWLHAPGKPTVLMYAHYDVQPPDPLDEWKTPPFEPTERNNNIYARGAVDDKGQLWMEVKALESLMQAHGGKLPINVKVLFEGEEEVGGESIAEYVRKQKAKLKADFALVCDTELFAPNLPTLCVGLRGLVYTEIEAIGAMTDLHSGMYGGAAPNPLFALVEIISKLKDSKGKILIPGVVSHATNVVEHPRLVADRIMRFAQVVGRENVIASTDCGLGGRIHTQIAWAKLAALAEGAKLATHELWQ